MIEKIDWRNIKTPKKIKELLSKNVVKKIIGKKRTKKDYILVNRTNSRTKGEHRLIWEEKYGKIPEGFLIHHKNWIKYDNRIENLQIVHKSEHLGIHSGIRRSFQNVFN